MESEQEDFNYYDSYSIQSESAFLKGVSESYSVFEYALHDTGLEERCSGRFTPSQGHLKERGEDG